MINDFIEFVKAARLFIFLSGKRETDLAHVPIILFGTTEGDDPSSALGGLPACR